MAPTLPSRRGDHGTRDEDGVVGSEACASSPPRDLATLGRTGSTAAEYTGLPRRLRDQRVMSEPYSLSESDEADLAALADDRLDPARRRRHGPPPAPVQRREAGGAGDPARARPIERQRGGREVITRVAGDVSAPL